MQFREPPRSAPQSGASEWTRYRLGLTHVLAGTMRYVYAGRAPEQQLVYSLFALIVRRFLT